MDNNKDEDIQELTLDDFNRWKVKELKNFLADRGIARSNKTKAELTALAYAAYTRRAPVLQTELEEKKQRAEEYRQLLKIDGHYMPDPLVDFKNNEWQKESVGMLNWPPVSIIEISEFLSTTDLKHKQSSHQKGQKLKKRMMNDYKEGKAYSYFDAEWLKEVEYHPVNDKSKVCVLRAECTPLERIKDPPHDVWVMVEKATGTVKSAHCGCFAGLSSTCNHIAVILFKIDHAFMRGWTTQSCTSKPCSWNIYSGGAARKVEMEGTRISDMEWRKPHFQKRGSTKTINPPTRKLFKPSTSTKLPTLEGLTGALVLFETINASSIQPYVDLCADGSYEPDDDINVLTEVECTTAAVIPPRFPETAAKCKTPQEFIATLAKERPSIEQIDAIEELTRGQAESPLWHELRKGRITGSKVHAVVTRLRTVEKDSETDVSNLVSNVMGYKPLDPSLPALKYGRLTEPHARNSYEQMMRHKCVDFHVRNAGLYLCQQYPLLAASPDGVVSCKCHGQGLLEIKCPFSIVGQAPTPMNLKYLTSDENGRTQLKRNHQYFTQIQLQIGASQESDFCDFYVYTGDSAMAHWERITFDCLLWMEICESSIKFLHNYLAAELVNPGLMEPVHVDYSIEEVEQLPVEADLPRSPSPTFTKEIVCRGRKAVSKPKKPRQKKVKSKPTYICALCDGICKYPEDIDTLEENSVGCELCRRWFHWGCVDFNAEEEEDEDWLCERNDCVSY